MLLPMLLACTADPQPADSGPVCGEGEGGSFSALTYNVHGLPPAITGDDTPGRMAQIAPKLNDYDLIGLQEDFDDDNHATLADAADFVTETRFAEFFDDSRFYGSGLALFASWPELARHHEHYELCYGTIDNSGDCLASKGFQVLRVCLADGAELDVYNTHMEAGGGDEDEAARADHVRQLVESMESFSAGRAVLFMGDTNLHPDDAVDVPLIDALHEGAGLEDACTVLDCSEPNHIDRMAYRSGQGLTLQARSWSNEPGFEDADGVPLSDHPAIRVDFEWALSE